MTGFGSAVGEIGTARLSLEIRSVNHRFFNPSMKIPGALTRWEHELREKLRQRVARGHVTLVLQVDRPSLNSEVIDAEKFAAYVSQLRELAERHELVEPQAADVLRLPGVVASPVDVTSQIELPLLLQLLDQALSELDSMRQSEGRRMADYLRERLALFQEALGRISERAPARLSEQHQRMLQSVAQLLGSVKLDEQRVAQEIAVMADKIDIAEEISRLQSHTSAFLSALENGEAEPAGKRLGFIIQEMLREVNTIGSKGADVEILRNVLLMKEELERVREQAENIE